MRFLRLGNSEQANASSGKIQQLSKAIQKSTASIETVLKEQENFSVLPRLSARIVFAQKIALHQRDRIGQHPT